MYRLCFLAMAALLIILAAACTSSTPPSNPVPTNIIQATATSSSISTPTHTPTPTQGPPVLEGQVPATITRVIDGDTVEVALNEVLLETVRLIGVDTPEIFSRNQAGEYGDITDIDCLDLWGAKATQFAAEILPNKSVVLVLDQPDQRDSYGRLLAYLLIDGEDFSAMLIEKGYGRAHLEYPSSRESQYLELQSKAISEGTGLWGCRKAAAVVTTTPTVALEPSPSSIVTASPVPTQGLTPSPEPQVAIRCIFYDGRVRQTEADEYVEIVNLGDATINLENWILKDISEGYPTFVFPDFDLMPGKRVRVYTNQTNYEWGGFTFSYSRAVWNNSDPDVAVLYDPTGREASRSSYPPGC